MDAHLWHYQQHIQKAVHKVDIPAFKDVVTHLPFPKLKYPLSSHKKENHKEELEFLSHIENIIQNLIKNKEKSIVALIVEPIQAEGGDNQASSYFFKNLRKICKHHNITFIVDEVQTGCCATGKWWCHEHWDLGPEDAPDIVTFAKKMQACGFYYKKHFSPHQGFRLINTWCGEPSKLLQLKAVIETIREENLLDVVNKSGSYLLEGLLGLQEKYPQKILNVRGIGTFLAFDCKDDKKRDEMIVNLRKNGIAVGGCGTQSIRIRPALIFEVKHCKIFIDALNNVLKTF